MKNNDAFDAGSFPLTGRRLIEASAGTGKTYNIANLCLRLLIGDGCERKNIDQILVVTFTRAATDELRGRIREKVELALHAFRGSACNDQFINILISKTSKRDEAARYLNYALLRMDEACIFTIHGFAVRAIQTFLFETDALANVELTEGKNHRKDIVLADLWRQLQLINHEKLRAYVDAMGFADRDAFEKYFAIIPQSAEILPAFKIKNPPEALDQLLPQVERHIESAVNIILEDRKKLAKRWKEIGDDKIKTALKHAKANDLVKRVNQWLESIETQLPFPGSTTQIYSYMLSFKTSAHSDNLTMLIRDLVDHAENSNRSDNLKKSAFRAMLLHYIRAKMQATDLASMQLDEVIALINNTLRNRGAKEQQLRSMITRSYPVCMVDEFQDTDPAQFEMFNRLYEGSEGAAFFMIGDPKQSIYGFRGADIFSYLGVKAEVQTIFSLDTNFRSKQALVAATNELFRENNKDKPVFLFQGIQYTDVKSCESYEYQQDKGTYMPGHKQLPEEPLVFIGNNTKGDILNGETLRWKYAQDTAQRIHFLLDASQPTTIKKIDIPLRTLRGGDIAVLVRSAREAGLVRDALLAQTPRIGSVFQSQRDSVFSSSIIADDIYHVLCAMDDPKDKNCLKRAMVTLLYRGFSTDFADLELIDIDNAEGESVFERLIDEFGVYQQYWGVDGVLSALNRFVSQRKLLQKIALLPDCDRLATDLRHLGELLQHKSMECSSREELLIWYKRQLNDDCELEEDAKRIRLESDDNLVKIVTIHVSKGLEYPIVFLPFFFLPWQLDANKKLPLFHPQPNYHARVDFSATTSDVTREMKKEMLAEDMRLLYVAMTRAIYQCYIGISAAVRGRGREPIFPETVWAHLLDIENTHFPDWDALKQALTKKFGENPNAVSYRQLFDTYDSVLLTASQTTQTIPPVLLPCATMSLATSNWVITSYSALAHTRREPGLQQGGADELLAVSVDAEKFAVPEDSEWSDNIRYCLQGSANTGDCLHGIFEQLALNPSVISSGTMDLLLQHSLQKHGLEKPEGINTATLTEEKRQQLYCQRRTEFIDWFESVLRQPLLEHHSDSSLRQLFLSNQILPELDFDFSLGKSGNPVKIQYGINTVLRQLGMAGITVPFRNEIEGLITGSIDLLFIHNKKVYVLDYKSNTLGKSPSYYDQANMTQAMKDNRYDLQYLIYAVAAHRYMRSRLGDRYDFDALAPDGSKYSFGGVFYLFLRGMGLNDYKRNGVWFHRPSSEYVLALDAVLKGKAVHLEMGSG